MRHRRRGMLSAGILAAIAVASGCTGKSCGSRIATDPDASTVPSRAEPPVLVIPKAKSPIAGDGDLDDPAWREPARTGSFVGKDGRLARPYSDARLLWDHDNLYVALYAADQDLRSPHVAHDGPLWLGDAFTLHITTTASRYHISIAVDGTVTDVRNDGGAAWESGTRAAIEKDGTLDRSDDEDEEWVVEAAIPWGPLGLDPAPGLLFRLSIERCDVPKGSPRTCASWGGDGAVVELGP